MLQSLKILMIGCLFILLFYWYTAAVKDKQDNDQTQNIIKKTLTFDKVARDCYISSSANRLNDKNAPLVIFLHGLDGAWPSRKFTRSQYDFINQLAWKNNFIAVFPQGTQGACHDPKIDTKNEFMFHYCWDTKTNKDRTFIKKLREAMISQYKVNSKEVYLIGFSNGAYFVSDYFLFHQDNLFAGYSLYSGGAYEPEKSKTDFSKLKVSLNVGNKDEFQYEEMKSLKNFLLNKGMAENINLKYFEYDARHEISKKALESDIQFFFKKN